MQREVEQLGQVEGGHAGVLPPQPSEVQRQHPHRAGAALRDAHQPVYHLHAMRRRDRTKRGEGGEEDPGMACTQAP